MNQFASLSAENDMHALAQVASNELAETDTRPVCYIESRDEGDEDRRLEFYDVVNDFGETLYSVPCTSIFQREQCRIDAATWANANGYRIISH